MSAPDDCGNDCFGPNGHAEGCPQHCGCYTADLSPEELATAARFEQAPDALGLREEVAEAAYTAIEWSGCAGSAWSRVPVSHRRKWYDLADALLPLIERREAEAVERAWDEGAWATAERWDIAPARRNPYRADRTGGTQ